MREKWIFITLSALFLILGILRPLTGWGLAGFWNRENGNNFDPEIEISTLRAKLSAMQDIEVEFPSFIKGGKEAFVFVTYPFNFKHELLVDAGEEDGIVGGKAAVLPSKENAVLVGRIDNVYKDYSVVHTIFDSDFQLGVRIGDKGVEALLQGGNSPRLSLIPKNAEIKVGDPVYAAGQGIPYGLSVGKIKEVILVNGGLLQEALLELPYDVNQIHGLTLITE